MEELNNIKISSKFRGYYINYIFSNCSHLFIINNLEIQVEN